MLSLFFGFIIHYAIFRAPESDIVFRACSDAEVLAIREYRAENGIRTHHENMSLYRSIIRGSGNPAPWHPPAPAGGGKRFLATVKNETSRVSSPGRSRC